MTCKGKKRTVMFQTYQKWNHMRVWRVLLAAQAPKGALREDVFCCTQACKEQLTGVTLLECSL